MTVLLVYSNPDETQLYLIKDPSKEQIQHLDNCAGQILGSDGYTEDMEYVRASIFEGTREEFDPMYIDDNILGQGDSILGQWNDCRVFDGPLPAVNQIVILYESW